MQYWGGPNTYSATRGHPRLRMRHAPFQVGAAERDAWLLHMRAAVDSLGLPEPHHTALWDYLERAAYFMVNTMDAPARPDRVRVVDRVSSSIPDCRHPRPRSRPMRRRLFAAATARPAAAAGRRAARRGRPRAVRRWSRPTRSTSPRTCSTARSGRMAVVGDTVVVGGAFTKVADSCRRTTYARQEHLRVRAARRRDPAVRAGGRRRGLRARRRRRTTPSTPAARSRP